MIRAHFRELAIEEVANATTHGLGLLLSIIGFVVLAVLAFVNGDRWHIASSLVYGISLVTLYAASTAYHTAITAHRKSFLQLVDHCCIYLLIAGTYTPFLLVVLRGGFGFAMLATVWAMALLGIGLKVMYRGHLKAVGIAMYLLMGWIGIVAVQPLYVAMGLVPLLLVVSGGISYSLGMIFFGWHRIRHNHAIFHVFVLVGSILHYVAIVLYVVPGRG